MKHYISYHSCHLGATKIRRVIAPLIAKKYVEMINAMPFIRPRHMRLVRKYLGVFITNMVCRNAKGLVLKRIEEQFMEDFRVLSSYALVLKATNPGCNVSIVYERQHPNNLPVF